MAKFENENFHNIITGGIEEVDPHVLVGNGIAELTISSGLYTHNLTLSNPDVILRDYGCAMRVRLNENMLIELDAKSREDNAPINNMNKIRHILSQCLQNINRNGILELEL